MSETLAPSDLSSELMTALKTARTQRNHYKMMALRLHEALEALVEYMADRERDDTREELALASATLTLEVLEVGCPHESSLDGDALETHEVKP